MNPRGQVDAEGELVDNDVDLEGYDKHKVFSQRCALLAFLSQDHLEDVDNVPLSIVDWRTRASKLSVRSLS